MDITITGKEPRKRRARVTSFDPWDGVREDGRCVYCGCPHDDHNGVALMGAMPGAQRRLRLGLASYHCKACAAAKGTAQAVCYLAPAGVYQRAEARGMTLYPPLTQ